MLSMISILTPHYLSKHNSYKHLAKIKMDECINEKTNNYLIDNYNDNRFLKLAEDRNTLNLDEKNLDEKQDEYIHFKKRKSYSYHHYKNFNNKKNMKSKYSSDDMYININNCIKDDNYVYNQIVESVNYPEIYIKNNDQLESKLKTLNVEINTPITSYGIVLYTYEKNKYLKYLVCQRRDSIAYIQYLQDLIDESNIIKYINLMSKEEKERCLEYYYKNDPHTIWKDLWINHNSKIYKNDYKRCTDNFIKNMEKYLHYFKDDNIGQKENPWCFPKGRMNYNENSIECALREFEEETRISSDNIILDKNIKFEELYIGSNNLLYKTIYYIAYIPYIPKKIYKFYPYNIRKKFISAEIYDMEWLEYQNAFERLNETKQNVLSKINNYILKRSFKK